VPLGRVLVVDDEVGVRTVCGRVLGQVGYEVAEATSGQEAVGLARRESFDLLLVDIMMPGMNGLETFRAVKALQPDLVGVVMTAYATVDNAVEAVNLGFSGFVVKPFRLHELEAAVREALAKRERERDLGRLETLAPLARLSTTVTSMDIDSVLQNVAQVAMEQTRGDGATVLLFAGGGEGEQRRASCGRLIECKPELLKAVGEDELASVFRADEASHPAVSAVLKSADLSCLAVARLALPERTVGLLCVGRGMGASPGLVGGTRTGGRETGTPRRGETRVFSSGDMEVLKVLGAQAAILVSNARLLKRVVKEEQLRRALQRYLSPRTVQAVLDGHIAPGAVSEARMMTVLLADVRDFSSLVEHVQLGHVIEVLHSYFSATVEIITAQQGVVDELSGDEILASFDPASGQDNHALRAVSAGLRMLERLDELGAEWLERGLPTFDIGIGVSSGPVVIGSIGSGDRRAVVTAGRILNLAARSQAMTRELGLRLIITQGTFEQVRDLVHYRELGAVHLKGISEPMGLYGVHGLKSE